MPRMCAFPVRIFQCSLPVLVQKQVSQADEIYDVSAQNFKNICCRG